MRDRSSPMGEALQRCLSGVEVTEQAGDPGGTVGQFIDLFMFRTGMLVASLALTAYVFNLDAIVLG